MIYGDRKVPTTPDTGVDYRPGDVPTYKSIPSQGMTTEDNKNGVGMRLEGLGLNECNTTLRTSGFRWDEKGYYLNTLLNGTNIGFAKDGNIAIGNAESLKETNDGIISEYLSIYSNRENAFLRKICVCSWITKSNTNPTEMQIANRIY